MRTLVVEDDSKIADFLEKGLRLSFVRAIVAAAGGRADVTTELGKGSAFRVRFPPAPTPET